MKIKFIMIFVALVAHFASAQTPPSVVLELSKRSDNIVKKGDLTTEQRAYLWDKTAQDRTGFLVVDVDPGYLDNVRYLLNDPAVKPQPSPALERFNTSMVDFGYSFVGVLNEDDNRFDAFYRDSHKSLLMVTRWEYKKAGAAITTAEEFFNQKVSGMDAVLSLARANNEKRCIWKLTWLANGVLYEIYLSDMLDSYGKPMKVPDEIIKVAQEVATNIDS